MSVFAKPYCKVCADAGKLESEYTSHWVKSFDGKTVTCPTVKAIKCGYCFNLGHTPKFCPVLANKTKMEEKAYAQAKYCESTYHANPYKNQIDVKVKTKFAMFESDDEEEQSVKTKTQQKTQIETKTKTKTQEPEKQTIFGWAAIVAKSAEQNSAEILASSVKRQIPPIQSIRSKTSWADYYDSDEDTELDEDDFDEDADEYV